jgi:hypothetical protein
MRNSRSREERILATIEVVTTRIAIVLGLVILGYFFQPVVEYILLQP